MKVRMGVLLGNILIGYALGWSAPVARKLQNIKETPLPYLLTDGEISWAAAVLTLGVIIVNIGHIISGYSMGWSAPVLEKLLDKEQSPLSDAITSSEASWVASTFNAGVVVGPLALGFLANIIGRKPCIILSSLTMLLGYVLLTVALDTTWIYCGQIVKGVGVVVMIVTDCIYIGEIASPNVRGMIMASTSVCHTLGILMAYSVGPFVEYRVFSGVVIVITIVHALCCWYFVPESPVFYVLKGEEKKAIKVLQELGRSKDIDTELKKMVEIHKENQSNANYLQLFTIKSNRMALLINTVLLILNQGGGIMCVVFYATLIFKNAASSVTPAIASIIIGATQVIGSIVTPFFIDKYGRKTLLLLSTALCSVFLATLGVYFYLELINYSAMSSIRWLPLFALMSYLFCFSFGINVIPNTLLGETFRPNMRSPGSTTAVTIGCFAGFVSAATFGYLVETIGSQTAFWIYAAINLIGFLFTLFVVPETKGKSLMEIEAILG